MPLLTKRLFWLERELAHDMWELATEYDYIGRRHYYRELSRACAGRSTAGHISRTRRRS